MMEKAFYTALMEVQVKKIKKKIESEWGNTLDRTTEAIVQTMTKQWQADVSKVESFKELYHELENIIRKKIAKNFIFILHMLFNPHFS